MLDRVAAGQVSIADKAELETLLFQYWRAQTERQLSNIQIALDCSLSMREAYGPQRQDTAHTRFDAAMDAINTFITARQGDAFGLTVFSRNFLHWVPLTQDVDAIRRARPFIAPGLENVTRQTGGVAYGWVKYPSGSFHRRMYSPQN